MSRPLAHPSSLCRFFIALLNFLIDRATQYSNPPLWHYIYLGLSFLATNFHADNNSSDSLAFQSI